MNRRIAVLIACFFTVLISYCIRYGYGVLLPDMLSSLEISRTEAGLIYSFFFIAYTIFSPLLGTLGDRYNLRLLIVIFVIVLGTGTLLMALVSSLTQAILFFTLAGIGSAACWAPVMALAQRWTQDQHRGKTLAFVDIGSALGIVISSAGLPLIVTKWDWRMGWLILGIAGLVIAAMDFSALRNPPKKVTELKSGGSAWTPGKTYLRLFEDFRFWLLGMAYLFTGFAIIIPFTFLTTFATKELNFAYANAAGLVMAIGISAVAGKILLGSFSDRIRRIYIMMLCGALIAGGCAGMAYARDWMLWACVVIFGVGYGAVWAMYAASASDYFSRDLAGTVVGLWTLYLGIGSTVSPALAGWIGDRTDTLLWSFILAAGGGIASLMLLLPIWKGSGTERTR